MLYPYSLSGGKEKLNSFRPSSRLPPVLAPGAAVVVSSTVPPSAAKVINEKLSALPNKPVMVDAPVSGGAARAANGDLTIMASGEAAGLKKAGTVLNACTKAGEFIFLYSGVVEGERGEERWVECSSPAEPADFDLFTSSFSWWSRQASVFLLWRSWFRILRQGSLISSSSFPSKHLNSPYFLLPFSNHSSLIRTWLVFTSPSPLSRWLSLPRSDST